jgi:hypothetical protein
MATHEAEQTQQIGHPFDAMHLPLGGEALQLELGLLDDSGVEQLSQFDPAEELAEHGAVDGEGGGTAFGEGAVALVHESADIAEEERPREG